MVAGHGERVLQAPGLPGAAAQRWDGLRPT